VMGKTNFSSLQYYIHQHARDNTSLVLLYSGVRYIFTTNGLYVVFLSIVFHQHPVSATVFIYVEYKV